jgi:hypothetical protein
MARAVEAEPDVPRHTWMYPTDFAILQDNSSIYSFTRNYVVGLRIEQSPRAEFRPRPGVGSASARAPGSPRSSARPSATRQFQRLAI